MISFNRNVVRLFSSSKVGRLIYQSKTRGMLENDILIGGFVEHHKHLLTEKEWDELDVILNTNCVNDWDIYYWITEKDGISAQLGQSWKELYGQKDQIDGAKTAVPMPEEYREFSVMKMLRKWVEDKRTLKK